jgi:excisionase family DNA binding protein
MKTRTQYRDWLHRFMVEVDNTRPDSDHCQKTARIAGKLACRHGLGGDFLVRSERTKTPTETVALLADCLKALDALGDDSGPFSVEEVAERWDVSVRTVGDLVRNGRLGCFRPGNGRGVIRISTEHIAEYERAQPTQRHRHLQRP